MAITVEYVLKKLAQKKRRNKYKHKTQYGREMGEKWGYDAQQHLLDNQRIKDLPFNPIRDWKE